VSSSYCTFDLGSSPLQIDVPEASTTVPPVSAPKPWPCLCSPPLRLSGDASGIRQRPIVARCRSTDWPTPPMPEKSQSGPHDRSPEPIEDRSGRRIRVQDRCRIDGAAHVYLGPADLPDSEVIVHVFARREWRPGTGRQPRFTLVRDDAISLVTLIGTPEPDMRRRDVAPSESRPR
jgi:hypothetical protein